MAGADAPGIEDLAQRVGGGDRVAAIDARLDQQPGQGVAALGANRLTVAERVAGGDGFLGGGRRVKGEGRGGGRIAQRKGGGGEHERGKTVGIDVIHGAGGG